MIVCEMINWCAVISFSSCVCLFKLVIFLHSGSETRKSIDAKMSCYREYEEQNKYINRYINR